MSFIQKNRNLSIIVIVAVVLLSVIWIWKVVEIRDIKNAAKRDRQNLKEDAIIKIVQSHEENLKSLAKAYVWAVRTQMMQGDINQVNLYALDLIKEKNFLQIAIANESGIIISSTNKKEEGKPFTSIGLASTLNNNNTIVENKGDSILIVTSPVMGFNKRLGTLLIKYAVQTPAFK